MPPSTSYFPCHSQQHHDLTPSTVQFGASPCPGVMGIYNDEQPPYHGQPSSPSANDYENTSYAPMFCGCIFQDEIDDDLSESFSEPSQNSYPDEFSKSCKGDHANFSRPEPSPDGVGNMALSGSQHMGSHSSHRSDHGPHFQARDEDNVEPWAAAISEMVLYFPTPVRIGPITFTEATTGLSWSGTTYTTCSCGATTRWSDFRPLHPASRTRPTVI